MVSFFTWFSTNYSSALGRLLNNYESVSSGQQLPSQKLFNIFTCPFVEVFTFLRLVRRSSAVNFCSYVRANNNIWQMILYVRMKFPRNLVNFTAIWNMITAFVIASLLEDNKRAIFVICDSQNLYMVTLRAMLGR